MVIMLGWNGAFMLSEKYSWPTFFVYQTVCCGVLLSSVIALLWRRRRLIASYRLPRRSTLDDSVIAAHFIFAAFILLGGYFTTSAMDAIFDRWLESAPYRGDTSFSNNIGVLAQIITFATLGLTMLVRPDLWLRIAYDDTNIA